jgi:chemotaxis response regulator CheB
MHRYRSFCEDARSPVPPGAHGPDRALRLIRRGELATMSAEFPVIAIGASAGALDAVRRITEALPRDCAAAIVVVFHVGASPASFRKS